MYSLYITNNMIKYRCLEIYGLRITSDQYSKEHLSITKVTVVDVAVLLWERALGFNIFDKLLIFFQKLLKNYMIPFLKIFFSLWKVSLKYYLSELVEPIYYFLNTFRINLGVLLTFTELNLLKLILASTYQETSVTFTPASLIIHQYIFFNNW